MSRVTHLLHITASLLPLTRNKTIHFSPLFALSTVVGFDKVVTPANKFFHLAAQFQHVENGKLSFDDIFSDLKGVDYGDGLTFLVTAPQVQFYDGKTYTVYYYLNDGWFDDNGKDGFKKGWCDKFGNIANLTTLPGTACWYKNPNNTDDEICGAGQVEPADEASVEVPTGIFSIIGNIYPMAVNFNDAKHVSYDGLIGVDYGDGLSFLSTAAQLQVFDGKNYTVYYYLNDGWFDDNGKDGFAKGWCDTFGNLADVNIGVQKGLWAWAKQGKFTINFKR